MARVTLELPERFGFSTEVQVYLSLVNYGGHLDNALLLTLVSEARVRFFQSLGYHESNVQGLSLVVGDMQAQYLSEAFHGETLRIDVAPRELSRCALDLVWRVSEASQGREVARGKTGLVFIDPASKRAATIPDAVRAETAWRYVQAYETITGDFFKPMGSGPQAETEALARIVAERLR